jgi:hypothetical protein
VYHKYRYTAAEGTKGTHLIIFEDAPNNSPNN